MKRRLVESRTGLLAIILLGVMALFVMRLFYLQIIKHGEYVELAKRSQQHSFVIPATRGEIFMMDGKRAVPVVLNQSVFTVVADPQVVKDSERSDIISSLKKVAGGEILPDAEQKLSNKKSRYAVLARNITRTQAEKLKKKDFAGILYQQGSMRSYPEGGLAAQVLGFVNADGDGQYGVEGGMDKRLKGRDGLLRSVTDVRSVPLELNKDNIRIEPQAGENVVLTIDRNIQSYAEEALLRGIKKARATEGSVIIMRPQDGTVLAMANYPSFEPATYYKQKNAAVFANPITQWPYEPASVIKTFLMATAIDKGAITPNSTYVNTNCIKVQDREMCNAVKGIGGTLTMQQVLNNSLNVGTITAARRLGNGSNVNLTARKAMYEYYHDKFGLGERTGIEVDEAKGNIYAPDGQNGNEVQYSTMTFGQGMNATMIQVSAGFCSVINGGEYYRPTLLAGRVDQDGNQQVIEHKPIRRTISQSTSDQVRTMLYKARNSTWLGKSDKKGYKIGGKTGTAEVFVGGSYTKNETVATYVGYGGANNPEYVIMVRVAAPGKGLNLEGGLHAGPIFADISNWMISYLKIAPRR